MITTTKWYSGTLGDLKFPDICLTGEEKPRKNLTQEPCPDRWSNPGPLRDKRACYHLLHRGGHMECQVEKLEHFRHILLLLGLNHSFLFLMLASRHHFRSRATVQDGNGRCFHDPIADEQSKMHIWPPADFLRFWLTEFGTHTPDFFIFPIEYKCHMMVEWSQFITFASSRVHWRGSLWINVFGRSSSNPEGIP